MVSRFVHQTPVTMNDDSNKLLEMCQVYHGVSLVKIVKETDRKR